MAISGIKNYFFLFHRIRSRLGKLTNTDLTLEWTTSDWSKCSQTCGENGTQIRSVECTLIKSGEEVEKIKNK